jgi:hypothetical protein
VLLGKTLINDLHQLFCLKQNVGEQRLCRWYNITKNVYIGDVTKRVILSELCFPNMTGWFAEMLSRYEAKGEVQNMQMKLFPMFMNVPIITFETRDKHGPKKLGLCAYFSIASHGMTFKM